MVEVINKGAYLVNRKLVFNLPAEHLKQRCIQLEDSAVGRLYDLDVIAPDGIKLSREEVQTCLVCGGPVTLCACSRTHT